MLNHRFRYLNFFKALFDKLRDLIRSLLWLKSSMTKLRQENQLCLAFLIAVASFSCPLEDSIMASASCLSY